MADTCKVGVVEAFRRLDKEQAEQLKGTVNLLRTLTRQDRAVMMMALINKSTETHKEEIALANSIIVNKIIMDFDGDRGILKDILEGIMKSVVSVEERLEREN